MQTFRTPDGSVSSVTRESTFLPRGRHRDPTLSKVAIQVRLLGNHCHLTAHPSSQGRSSPREDEHPVVCPPEMLQWHVLLKEVWGVTTGSLCMGSTPAKAPETRSVSLAVIQMHKWGSSKKELLVGDTAGDSFAKGLMQKCTWSTGHPRAFNELHLALKYTWRSVGLVP